MALSYIGITGFNSYEQVTTFNEHMDYVPIGHLKYLMYGFTSSNKRLADPTSSGKTSPSLATLEKMVNAVPSYHLPMIHYYTPNLESLAEEIGDLFAHCSLDPFDVGLQLNALWPDISQVSMLKRRGHTITLQLPAEAIAAENVRVVDTLKKYSNCIDYVLIDPSGGQGKDFNVNHAASLMALISKEVPELTPGVAGGFSCDNVSERIRAIREYSKCNACDQPTLYDYCIDAQGRLRTDGQLDIEKAASFVNNALSAFSE